MVRKVFSVLLVVVLSSYYLFDCGKSEENKGNDDAEEYLYYLYEVNIRNVDYSPINQVDLLYKNEPIDVLNENGLYTFLSKENSLITIFENISILDKVLICYDYYNSESQAHGSFNIFVCNESDIDNRFYFMNGKIVKHYGGEEVESGVVLKVNDNIVYNSNDGRDFNCIFMPYNTPIYAEKDGYEFVDINAIPYNERCFSKQDLMNSTEEKEVYINGVLSSLKLVSGVTFRAKAI